MTTPIDTKNQDAAELVGLDDAPEFYDEAKRIQKPYGLKRHDEICDHLEQVQRMSEADVVTASVGIWMGIESERQHKNKQITALREENERLKAEHEKFCIGAQQKTDADFKVTREAAERAREQLSVERERSKKLVDELEHASKRSSYKWSEGPGYTPSDHNYEGRISLATFLLAANAESESDEDPTLWCNACGAATRKECKCPPIADNE